MPSITIRELSRNTTRVVDDVQKSGRPALVTRNGKFVAAVVPIDEDELEDWILSTAPEFVESMREADRDLAEGRTVSLKSLLDELDPQ
jgi:prevent-host-death family protein